MSTRKPGKAAQFNVDPNRIGKLANPETTHERSTDNTQTTHERSTTARLKRYDVRLSEADWQRLGNAADTEGSSRGAIIRRLVKGYLRGE